MELKKKFVLGFMTLALAVSCGNKSDKNNAKDSSVNKPEVEIVNNNDAGDKERKLKKTGVSQECPSVFLTLYKMY